MAERTRPFRVPRLMADAARPLPCTLCRAATSGLPLPLLRGGGGSGGTAASGELWTVVRVVPDFVAAEAPCGRLCGSARRNGRPRRRVRGAAISSAAVAAPRRGAALRCRACWRT